MCRPGSEQIMLFVKMICILEPWTTRSGRLCACEVAVNQYVVCNVLFCESWSWKSISHGAFVCNLRQSIIVVSSAQHSG